MNVNAGAGGQYLMEVDEMPHRLLSVVVVDDTEPFRRIIGRALESYGYDVAEAATEQEMWHLVGASRPDAVVLDWYLPDSDPATRFERLLGSGIPVVVVTGDPDGVPACTGDRVAVLGKPIHLDDLRRTLESVLGL